MGATRRAIKQSCEIIWEVKLNSLLLVEYFRIFRIFVDIHRNF